jgi:putative endonuclease
MIHYVYVISSLKEKYIYVGTTKDPKVRINQHQSGKEKTTRFYRPFRVLFIERFASRLLERKREKYLKSGIGKEWIKQSYK